MPVAHLAHAGVDIGTPVSGVFDDDVEHAAGRRVVERLVRLKAQRVDALVVVETRAIRRVRDGLAPSPAFPVEVRRREVFLVTVRTVERLKVAVVLTRDVDRVGVQLRAVGREDSEQALRVPGLIAGLEEALVLATRIEKIAPGTAVIRRAEHILGEEDLLLTIHDRL